MQGLFDRTLARIDQGLSGQILVIPTGIPKYDEFVYGTRKGCYYLYGAETGVGKTKFIRENHLYKVYDEYKRINDPARLDIEFLDFSLEISAEENMASAISRRIYNQTGRVIPANTLFSWGSQLPPADRELVASMRPYFTEFERKLWCFDGELTPTFYHDALLAYARANGRFTKEGATIGECEGYIPNNPNKFTIILVDTVNLSDTEPEHNLIKTAIDRISRISVLFRNKCGFTPIIIQQFNAEISAVDRGRYGIKTPLLRDFEDSKRTTKDANVVWGLFDPMRHMKPDESTFMGYDIEILKSWFRSLHLLKHRNGQSNKFIPLQCMGAVGLFNQLPSPSEMTPEDYVRYTRY